MAIFLNAAAYGFQPIVSAGCNATQQEAGYTYYRVRSGIDVSIPQWTIRVANAITSSFVVGYAIYCANAQYASASFMSGSVQQQASPLSDRVVSGSKAASSGLAGWVVGFSSESCFTDEWTTNTCKGSISSGCSTVYGGNFAPTFINFILRDRTKFTGVNSGFDWNNWGNQPWKGTCATYQNTTATSHQYISCSTGTATTSSITESVCAREWAWSGTGTTGLVITNYYTGSCGTY